MIRILHVDDEPGFVDTTAEFLEREDEQFAIEPVTGAEEGLARLEEGGIDCIVSDYEMSGTDGIEFLERVRETYPDLPFILFTGKGSEEIASEAISAGVTDYLQKESGTAQYELLANRIRRAVEQHRAQRYARLQEREYRELFEQAPIMYVLVRDEGGEPVIEDCNDRFAEKLGYDRGELVDSPLADHYTEESVREMIEGGGRERALEGEFGTEERTLVTSAGEQIDVRARVSPRFDASGGVVGTQTLYLDITERKARERELRRYERMVNTMQESACIYDADGRFELVNEYLAEFYGTTPEELEGERSRLVPRIRAEHDGDGDPYQELLDGEREEIRGEIDAEFPGHGHEIIAYRLTPLVIDGSVESVVGVAREITEQRRRQRRFEAIFNNTYSFVGLMEPDGTLLEANETALSFGGLDREAVVGRPVWETYWFQANEAARRAAREAVERARNGEVYRENITVQGADREAVIDFSVRPITDGSGEVTLLVPEGRDITEREEQREQLRETTARLEALYERSPDLIDVLDSEGRIRDANRRFREELGYAGEELVGTHISEIDRTVDADDVERILSDLDTGQRRKFEARYERADGSTFPVEVHLMRLNLDGADRFLAISRDITERRAQARKRERIIERVTDAIVEVDADWRFTLVNDQAEELYDMDEGELLGRNFWDVFAAARNTRFEEVYRGVMESREPDSMVEYYPGLEGWFDIQVYPTDDGGVAFYFREITERRRQARELERAEARYRALAENFPNGGVFYFDEELRYQIVSGTGFEPIETSPDDLIGNTLYEVEPYSEAVVETLEPVMEGTLEGNEETIEIAYEDRVYELRSAPIRDADGEVTAGLYITQDITDQRRRERELERYETMANAAGDMVYILDTEGRFEFVNDTAAELTGYPRDRLLGAHVGLFMDEEDIERGRELIADLHRADAEDRVSDAFSFTLHRADGDSIPCESHVTLLYEDGEWIGTVGVVRDVTERERRERELERQNERLEEFARVVSHDLRNPLNVAEGRLDLAREDCDSDHLDIAAGAVDRSLRLVDDLLTLARKGKRTGEVEPVALDDLLTECWQHVETTGAELVADVGRTVRADRDRLGQLLGNLIRNGVEHGGEDVTIRVGELEDRDGFYVADDGPGIPPDEREAVFETGYSTSDDGTGFGLDIVQAIVEAHGWAVEVTDGDAGGARFEITGVEFVD